MTPTFKAECSAEDAPRFIEWFKNRGGIARWPSIDLRNAGAYVTTPALTTTGEPTTRPGWQYSNTPEIITDPAEVGVYEEVLFKAIPVSLRRSSNGLTLKVSDSSMRKVRALEEACERKHGSAHTRKGVLPEATASIGVFYTTSITPLSERM